MTALRVIEIFDSLQGEGYWTGVPMTFVRLAGCNAPVLGLDCTRWCDTPASWDPDAGEELDAAGVVSRVRLPRLCLTGGEPLLQPEGVAALIFAAHRRDIRVHVETNGTIGPPGPAAAGGAGSSGGADRPGLADSGLDVDAGFDWVVVSPKPPDYWIAPEWEGFVDELKLVVDEHLDAAIAERLAAAHPGAFVSIQPVWQPGPEAAQRAIALVLGHPEWRLSAQVHKYLGMQ